MITLEGVLREEGSQLRGVPRCATCASTRARAGSASRRRTTGTAQSPRPRAAAVPVETAEAGAGAGAGDGRAFDERRRRRRRRDGPKLEKASRERPRVGSVAGAAGRAAGVPVGAPAVRLDPGAGWAEARLAHASVARRAPGQVRGRARRGAFEPSRRRQRDGAGPRTTAPAFAGATRWCASTRTARWSSSRERLAKTKTFQRSETADATAGSRDIEDAGGARDAGPDKNPARAAAEAGVARRPLQLRTRPAAMSTTRVTS